MTNAKNKKMLYKLDQLTIEFHSGETILHSAARAGVELPTLCHCEFSTTADAGCMLCAVYDTPTQKFLPACATPATENLNLENQTPRVVDFRRRILALLISEHSDRELKCHCRARQTCKLRQYALIYGATAADFPPPITPPEFPTGATAEFIFDGGKCIRCGICVRMMPSVGLSMQYRGEKMFPAPPLGSTWEECLSAATANAVVAQCPTAALSRR